MAPGVGSLMAGALATLPAATMGTMQPRAGPPAMIRHKAHQLHLNVLEMRYNGRLWRFTDERKNQDGFTRAWRPGF